MKKDVFILESQQGTRIFVEKHTGHLIGCKADVNDDALSPVLVFELTSLNISFLFELSTRSLVLKVKDDKLHAPVLSYIVERSREQSFFYLRHPSSGCYLSVNPPPSKSYVSCDRREPDSWEKFHLINYEFSISDRSEALLNAIILCCRSLGLKVKSSPCIGHEHKNEEASVVGAVRRLKFCTYRL